MSTFNPVQYVKNVTRSVGYVAKESLKELNPTIAEFADTNNDTIREMYSAARDFKKNAKSGAQRLAESEYVKIGKETMLNFFDDLRTGNFYNKERSESSAAAAAGLNFDDDWDIDAEVNFGEDDDNSDTLTMSGMDEIGSKISQANAKATILSADYIVKANKATTKSMMAHNEMMFGKVQTSIAGINSTIASIGQSSLKAASAHYENSTKFYDFMTKQTAEQTGYMKQIYELLNARFNPKKTERSFGKNAYRDIVGYNGTPDLAAWGKNIKSNFDDMMSLYTSIGGMFTPDMVRHMLSSPVSSLMKMGTVGIGKGLFGKDLEKFNKTLGGLFGSAMLKLNRKASDDPYSIKGMIASLLGIEPSKTKKIDTSKYDKGRTDWTGKDAKALREVIPTQLAQILAALTGKEAKVFDYERGRWVSYSKMQDNLKKDVKGIVDRNTSDIREQFEKYFLEDYADKGITKNSKAYRTYQLDQSNFFKYLTMNNSRIPLNETQWNALETQMKRMKLFVDAANPNGIMLYSNFRKIRSYYRRNARNGLGHLNMQANGNMITARNEIGNFYERQSTDPSSQYGMLFNGSGLGTTGENASKTSLLNITIDDKGNNIFFYLQNFYSDLKKIVDNTANGSGGGGGTSRSARRRRRREQKNNYDVPTNLSENPNNPTQQNKREFTDVENVAAAEEDTTRKERRKTHEEEAKEALENKFKNSKLYKLLGKHGDALANFFNLPIKTVRGAIDAADKRMYELIYGKEDASDENEERGILDKIMEGFDKTFDSIKKSAKKFLKETVHPFFTAVGDKIANWFGYDTFKDMKDKALQGIKNSKFVQGVKENLKSAGRWVKNSVKDTVYETGDYFTNGKFSKGMDNLFGRVRQFGSDVRDRFRNNSDPTPPPTDDEGAPQAARGGMVTKSGMISVSEGEMIIPSERNPYYHGHKSTSSQLTSERGIARKWKAMTGSGSGEYWGEFAGGGTTGPRRGRRVNRSMIRGVHRGYQRVKRTVMHGAQRASEIFDDTREDVEDIIDDVRQTEGYKKTSAAFDWATKVIKNGAMSIVNRLFGSNVDEDGNIDDGKSSKEKIAKTMKTAFGEVKKYAPTVAAGGILGGAASLIGGLVGGPLVGAGVGAAIGLATKSEKFQNYLFGEIDDKGNRKGGFFGPKFSNFLTKRFPRLAKFGATGGLMGLTGLIPGGPIAGLMVGSAMGFLTENDRLHDYLFGEEGLLGKDTDKKLKRSLPKAALGAAIGAFTGPFGLVGNIMLGGALGFASDTDKFREALFGIPDSNGELQGGLLGIVREDVIDPMKNYFKGGMKKFEDYMTTYIFDPIKEFLRPAGDLLGAAIQNTFDSIGSFIKKEFTDKVGTPIMKFLQSKFFKPISNAVGWLGKNAIKIAAAPGKWFGKTLNSATRKLDRKAISKGYSSLSAEDRALAATTDRRLGGMNYATKEYDAAAAGMSAEELEEAKKDLDLYRNTKRGQKLDKKKMRADSIKQILADSEWGTTLKEDKRIKRAMDATIESGNFDAIYEVVRQMDRKGQFNGKTDKLMAFLQEREQKIKDIDNTDISDIENKARETASKLGIDVDTYYKDKNLRRLMAGDIRHKKKDSEPTDEESKHKVLDPNKKTTIEYAVDKAVDYLKEIRDAIVKVAGGEAPSRRYETGNIFGRKLKVRRRSGDEDESQDETESAARGGMVTKSGMISVSEGEMIIPSERNPYYHGITNKRQQILNEKTVASKYKAMGGAGYLGSYARGGIVGNLMGAVKEIAHTPIDMYRDVKSAFGSTKDQMKIDGASPASLIKSEFSKSTGYLAGIQAALFKMAGIEMKQEQDKDSTIAKVQRNVNSAISRAKSKLFGGNSEEDTKVEVDSEGNAIRYVKDAQGNWSPDIRDSGTKSALDNAKKSKTMKEKVMNSLTSLPGMFGGLFTKFFGKDDGKKEKKGILESLLEKVTGVFGGITGKINSFFTDSGIGQAILGAVGLITGASILNWINEQNPELIPKVKEKLNSIYENTKNQVQTWWDENKDGIGDKVGKFFLGGINFIMGAIKNILPKNMDEWFQFFVNSGKRAKNTYDGIEDFLTGHDSSKYGEGEYERANLSDRFLTQGLLKNSLIKGQTGNAILRHVPLVGKSANAMLSGVGHARNYLVDNVPKGVSKIGTGIKNLVGKTGFGAKMLDNMGTNKALKNAASRFVGEGVDSKQFREVMQSFIMSGMGADEAAQMAAQNLGGELLEQGTKKPGVVSKLTGKAVGAFKGSKVGGKVVDVISDASTKATNAVSTLGTKMAGTKAGGKAVELVTKLKTMVASCLSKVMKLLGKSSDEIVEKGARELAEAAVQEGGEKAVAGSLAKAAALPIQIAFIAAAVENGWEDAKSILGILDEPTLAQRAVAAAVNGCNEAIPGIGGIIPTEIIFSVLLNVFNALGIVDGNGLLKQREEARAIVDEYNAENNKTYNVREYVKNVLGEYTTQEKIGNTLKKAGGAVVKGVKGFAKGAKDLGSKAVSGVKNLGGKFVEGAKSFGKGAVDLGKKAWNGAKDLGGKAVDKAKELGKGAVDLVKGAGQKVLDVAGYVKEVRTSFTNLQQKMFDAFTSAESNPVDAAMAVELDGISEDNPLGGFAKSLSGIVKVATVPMIFVKQIGTGIKNKIIMPMVETVKSTAVSLAQNEITANKLMLKGDVQGLLNAKAGEGTDDKNPIGWLTNVDMFIRKLTHIAPTAISWLGHKVVEKFNEYKGTMASTGAAMVQNRVQALKFMADGDVQGLLNMKGGEGIGEDDPIGWINGVSAFINKVSYIAPTAISWVGHKIVEKFNEYKGTIISTGAALVQSRLNALQYVAAGDIQGLLSMEGGEGIGEDNPIGWINTVGAFINKITYAIPTGISWVGHKIVEKFNEYKGTMISTGASLLQSYNAANGFMLAGDIQGLLNMEPGEGAGEDNPIGWIASVGNFANKITHVIPTAISWVGHKIVDGFKSAADGAKKVIALAGVSQTNAKKYADAGDPSGLWSMSSAEGAEGPFGFIVGTTDFIAKATNTVPAIFGMVSNKIKESFKSGKLSDVVSLVKNVWSYTDPKKDISGLDKLIDGAKSKDTGFMAGINNLAVTIGGGITKAIVFALRPINQIIDTASEFLSDPVGAVKKLLNKAGEKANEFANSSSSSSTQSGAGSGVHVSQKDPTFAGSRFGKKTIGEIGCGPAVAATVLRTYGKNGDLGATANYAKVGGYVAGDSGMGTRSDYFRDILGQNGINSSYSDNKSDIRKAIGSGNPTILLGQDKSNTSKSNSPFGPNPHYVVAQGMDNHGNVVVDDPELGGTALYRNNILKNAKLGIMTGGDSDLVSNGASKTVDGNTPQAKVYQFYTQNGFTPAATAGIMGNIQNESGFKSDIIQGNGKGPAAGLFQWENYNKKSKRWAAMNNYAQSKGKPWTDLQSQMEWALQEMQTENWMWKIPTWKNLPHVSSLEEFKKMDNPANAAVAFSNHFERPGKPHNEKRAADANNFYEQFTGAKITNPTTFSDSSSSSSSGSTGSTDSGSSGSSSSGLSGALDSILNAGFNAAFGAMGKLGEVFKKFWNTSSSSSSSGSSDSSSSSGIGTSSVPAGTFEGKTEQEKKIMEVAKEVSGYGMSYKMTRPVNIAPGGYGDCSSTVGHILQKSIGVNPGGNTAAQLDTGKMVLEKSPGVAGVDESKLRPGDLLLYQRIANYTAGRKKRVGHVEMYIGGGKRLGHGGGIGPKITDLQGGDSANLIQVNRYTSDVGAGSGLVLHDFTKLNESTKPDRKAIVSRDVTRSANRTAVNNITNRIHAVGGDSGLGNNAVTTEVLTKSMEYLKIIAQNTANNVALKQIVEIITQMANIISNSNSGTSQATVSQATQRENVDHEMQDVLAKLQQLATAV